MLSAAPRWRLGGYQRFDIRIEQRIAVENQDFVSSGLCQDLLDRASGAQRFAFDRVDEFESGKGRGLQSTPRRFRADSPVTG